MSLSDSTKSSRPPTRPVVKNTALTGRLALALAVLLLSIVPFIAVIPGSAVWDDNRLLPDFGITGGHGLLDVLGQTFLDRYYRPLVGLSFWLDHALWGTNSALSHAVNVLLHAGSALLLTFALLRARGSQVLAAVGGLLFAVQPAQIVSTAWIGGRTDVLATFFVALMAYCLVRRGMADNGGRWLLGACLAYGGAVFSKEQCLPMILLTLIPVSASPQPRSARKSFIPMLVVAAAYIALWAAIAPPRAVQPPFGYSPFERIGHTALYYGQLLLAPSPATLHTLTNQGIAEGGAFTALAGWAVLLGALALLGLLWKREPFAGWWWTLALLGVVPVLNFVATPSFIVAPYKLGPAGLGVAAVMAIGLVALGQRVGRARALVYGLGGAVMTYFLVLGTSTASHWHNEELADQTIVRYDPASLFARYNLAVTYLHHHEVEEGAGELQEILRRVLGEEYATMDGPSVLEKLRRDPRPGQVIDASQGYRRSHESWLARVYIRLAETYQSQGNDAKMNEMLEIGRLLNQAAGANIPR
jgi:hypothetical protein